MAEEQKTEIKELPKYLIRPVAIMRMFHEAARMGFKDMIGCLTECESAKTTENAQKLSDTFDELEICITIHKEHEDKGLYPALLSSINERLEKKNYNPSKEKLEEGLKEIPSFVNEHKEDHKILHEIKNKINLFIEAVNNKKNDEINESFKTVDAAIKKWTNFHEEHLEHEEKVMAPLMKGIKGNKAEKSKLARTFLDLNYEKVLKYQFEYVVKQSLKWDPWFCPMTKHKYVGIESTIAYIQCFRMMSKDQNEYKLFIDKVQKNVNDEQWKEIKSYGLDNK